MLSFLQFLRESAESIIMTLRVGLKHTTASQGDTRFILPDGTRLTFESRMIHAQAVAAFGLDLGDVIKAGVIRVSGISGIDTSQHMTETQANIIHDQWMSYGEGTNCWVDVSDDSKKVVATGDWDMSHVSAGAFRSWVNKPRYGEMERGRRAA